MTLENITDKCKQVFSETLQSYDPIPELVIPDLSRIEAHPILKTKIVGKEDVPIGALITKLGNSDWIKQGLGYLEQTENQCPFCQQSVVATLKAEIESVFDETYEQQIRELKVFQKNYSQIISSLIENLKQIASRNIPIINFSELKAHIRLIEEEYKNNLVILEDKIKSPSKEVELKSLLPDLEKAQKYIAGYRATIEANNLTAKNIGREKTKLKSEIWRFIVDELSTDLTNYHRKLIGYRKAIESIQEQIDQRVKDKKRLKNK